MKGEEGAVKKAISKFIPNNFIFELAAPATLDGGDVLWTGNRMQVMAVVSH